MARLGAIDIGSNALRLRIVDVDPPDISASGARAVRFRPFREVHHGEDALLRDLQLRHDVQPGVQRDGAQARLEGVGRGVARLRHDPARPRGAGSAQQRRLPAQPLRGDEVGTQRRVRDGQGLLE